MKMDSASESKLSGVSPALANIVRQMAAQAAARGGTLRVISGLRTYAQQAALYANRANNSNPVAAPGTSLHEKGLAVDLTWSGVSESFVGQLGEGYGLRWGGRFRKRDPGHFELTGSSQTPDASGDSTSPDYALMPYGSTDAGANDGAALAAMLLLAGLLVVRIIRG